MDKDNASIKMDQFIMENGKIIANMVGAILQIIKRTNTQDNLLIASIMEKEKYSTMMAPISKETSRMVKNKAKDASLILMVK